MPRVELSGRGTGVVRHDSKVPAGPGALVLIAGEGVQERLGQVLASGWTGPVVLVGTVQEARDLVGTPRPAVPEEALAAAPPARVAGRQVVLDPDRQVVAVAGREESLTPLEFGFLQALLSRSGRVYPFPDLTDQIWGTRHLRDVSQVHSVVKRLRRKLDALDSPVQVQAVRGVGFRAVVRP